MPDLRKVRPGEPFAMPAGAYNAFVDAALAARRGADVEQPWKHKPRPSSALSILVKNTSGASIFRFEPAVLGDALFDPAEQGATRSWLNDLVIKAGPASVAGGTPARWWGIAEQEIAPGQLGRVAIGGLVPTKVNVVAAGGPEEAALYCDCIPGQQWLRPMPGGTAPILWRETGIGVKWAYVQLGLRVGTVVRAGRVTAVTPTGDGPHPIEDVYYSIQPNYLPTSGLLTNVVPWRPMGVPNSYKIRPAQVGEQAVIIYDHTALGAEAGTPSMVLVPERLGVGPC